MYAMTIKKKKKNTTFNTDLDARYWHLLDKVITDCPTPTRLPAIQWLEDHNFGINSCGFYSHLVSSKCL